MKSEHEMVRSGQADGAAGIGEAMLAAMVRPGRGVEELGDSTGGGLRGVSEWALSEGAQAEVHGLRMVEEMQAQMLASRCRLQAIARLIELASQAEDPRIALGACRELVRADVLGQRSILERSKRRARQLDEVDADARAVLVRLMYRFGAEQAEAGEQEGGGR